MKNKLFNLFFYATTVLMAMVFISLFISLIIKLRDTASVRHMNINELSYAIKLSLFTATVSSIFAIIAGIPVAYLLARRDFPCKIFIDTLFDLTIVLSPIAIGAMVLVFFNTGVGRYIENNFLRIVFEPNGIIFAQFLIITGFSVRFLKFVFESVNEDYENIARTLGADTFKVFTKITLPLASRGIFGTFLLIWARAIGEFGASVTIAGATTMKTETLPIAIFLSFESADLFSAIIYILVLLCLALLALYITRKVLRWRKFF